MNERLKEFAQDLAGIIESNETMTKALREIDDIRNDIVGRQSVGFSQHIYPLVAILERAGFHGIGHEKARARVLQFSKLLKACQGLYTRFKQEQGRADRLQRHLEAERLTVKTLELARRYDVAEHCQAVFQRDVLSVKVAKARAALEAAQTQLCADTTCGQLCAETLDFLNDKGLTE